MCVSTSCTADIIQSNPSLHAFTNIGSFLSVLKLIDWVLNNRASQPGLYVYIYVYTYVFTVKPLLFLFFGNLSLIRINSSLCERGRTSNVGLLCDGVCYQNINWVFFLAYDSSKIVFQ